MKADELEDLKIYSKVLSENMNTISVLGSLLEVRICDAVRCMQGFKEHVNDISLKYTRKNH